MTINGEEGWVAAADHRLKRWRYDVVTSLKLGRASDCEWVAVGGVKPWQETPVKLDQSHAMSPLVVRFHFVFQKDCANPRYGSVIVL